MLTESFNELGEDPGVAFHETPLPGIARHGPDHTHRPAPPRALRSPQRKLPPAADLSKTRRGASTPRHPAYFPTASGRRHLPRDRARKDALATQETSKLLGSLSGSVAPSAGPEKGRGLGAPEEGTSGTLGTPELGRSDVRGGARDGAGLAPTRTWSFPRSFGPPPIPGATQGFCRRRGSEHRLPGTGGSLQACCGPRNRVLCSPSDSGHLRSGRCALSSTGIPASEARQSLRRLCAPAHAGPISHPNISNRAQLLRRMESWGTQVNSPACKAPGERACQGPLSLFLSLFLRLWHRGVVSDTGWGRSFVGRPKTKLS